MISPVPKITTERDIFMNNSAIQKINGFGKAGRIIANICKILVIIAIVAVIVATVILFILPKDLVQIRMDAQADVTVNYGQLNGVAKHLTPSSAEDILEEIQDDIDFEFNGMEFTMDTAEVTDESILVGATAKVRTLDMGHIRIVLIFAIFALALVLVSMHFICSFCKALEVCKSPFEDNMIRKMQQLAWALVCLPFASSIAQSISESVMTGRVSIGLHIDMMEVIVILAVFALTYIFKYGAVLQRESDETL